MRQRGTLRRLRGRLRKRHDAIEVERALGDVGEPVETVFQIGGLSGLHESKVPFRQREAGIAGDRAEQGRPIRSRPSSTRRRCRSLATLFSTTPATRMRGSKRAQPSATAAADWACPDASSTRSTGQPKRAAMSALAPVRPAPPHAVEQTHRTLGDDQIGVARRRLGQRRQKVVRHGEGVEVEARRAGRGGMEGRVDVVGAAFDAADAHPPADERALEPERDGRLARARARGGDERPGAGLMRRPRG